MRTRLDITMITIVSCFFLCVCVCLIGLLATELIEPMSDVFFICLLMFSAFCRISKTLPVATAFYIWCS